jgi:hypothetical protein
MIEASNTPAPNWLTEVFRTAQSNNWCMRPYCTTCGAQYFRLAIFQNAYNFAGSEIRKLSWSDVWNGLTSLSEPERKNVTHEIAERLRTLPSLKNIPENGLRVVFMDLDRMYDSQGNGLSLDEGLGATPAGNYLALMRRHSARLSAERAEQGRIEKENTEKRKRRKSSASAQTRAPRAQWERIESGNGPIHKFLRKFREISVADRLKILAADDFMFPLEIIPRNLIPLDTNFFALSAEERKNLVRRIGNRSGRWRRLKKLCSN